MRKGLGYRAVGPTAVIEAKGGKWRFATKQPSDVLVLLGYKRILYIHNLQTKELDFSHVLRLRSPLSGEDPLSWLTDSGLFWVLIQQGRVRNPGTVWDYQSHS